MELNYSDGPKISSARLGIIGKRGFFAHHSYQTGKLIPVSSMSCAASCNKRWGKAQSETWGIIVCGRGIKKPKFLRWEIFHIYCGNSLRVFKISRCSSSKAVFWIRSRVGSNHHPHTSGPTDP